MTLLIGTIGLAASPKEIDACVVLLIDFKKFPDKERSKEELEKLKQCLATLKAAEREPPATIFRRNTTKE